MPTNQELLEKASERPDLFKAVIVDDAFDDWPLAQELGEYLLKIAPKEIMGYALFVRSSRHLGVSRVHELEICRTLLSAGLVHHSEAEMFSSFLDREQTLGGTATQDGTRGRPQ